MKGPYERLKYDLRRVWQCPLCRRRERTSGAVTFRFCQCQMKHPDGKPVLMKLVADGVRRVGPPPSHLRPASAPSPDLAAPAQPGPAPNTPSDTAPPAPSAS
jgi:hypothetical protein